MHLTFSTDYALRVLILVGLEPERLVAIEEGRGSLRNIKKSFDESNAPAWTGRIP